MTRVFIMAGGEDAKWAGHLGVRRHFAPINGEPLVRRQLRQLRERGIVDVRVVAPDLPAFRDVGVPLVAPTTSAWGQEALNAQALWSVRGRTIQLYGDTVFTDAAMDTIVGFDAPRWQAFGRHGPGGISPWGELFAISFWPAQAAAWAGALRQAFALKARGTIRRAGSWEGYRVLGGAKGPAVGRHLQYPALFTEINDHTDDFDTPEEYEALVRLWS